MLCVPYVNIMDTWEIILTWMVVIRESGLQELTFPVSNVTFSLVLGINTTARVFSPVKSQVNDNAADSDEHLSRITLVFIPKISRPSRDVDW